ncbi:MAG TPA: DbpA RNA binding domain-containing protein, partial [Phenylobacterium sp.]|nr:DbpA RNA binding domain-containing protein [Phenylobacterium sp.]
RLLDDPLLNEPASPEDLELGRRLLEGRSPEAVAAALIRLHRARLPEPEDMFDDVRDRSPDVRPPRPDRGPRETHDAGSGAGWFRLPVGRSKNADPKWLVPLICRLGHVTKKEIGLIRILDNETRFEIAPDVDARFRQAIRAAADAGEIRINPSAPPGAPGPRPQGGPPRKGPPRKGPPPKGPAHEGPPRRKPGRKANG